MSAIQATPNTETIATIPDLKTEPEATSEDLTLQESIIVAAIASIKSWIVGVMLKMLGMKLKKWEELLEVL